MNNKKTNTLVFGLISLGLVSSLNAQISVSNSGIGNNTEVTAPVYTISGLDGASPTASVDATSQTAFGTGAPVVSGEVSGSSGLSGSDSFSFTLTGSTSWDETTALSNLATLDSYLGTVSNADLYYFADDIAVGNNRLDAGEAIFMSFDTDSLSGDLTLTDISMGLGGQDDSADFWVWDSDTQTLLSDQQVKSTTIAYGEGFSLTTGDIVVLGNAGLGDFRLESISFDVAAVPEPSFAVLVAGLLALGFLGYSRQKRK